MDDNPYTSPQHPSGVDRPPIRSQFTLGRIYLYLHAVIVTGSALFSLADAGEVTLNAFTQTLVALTTAIGIPLLFISPLICITMLGRAIFQDNKHVWFALAEFLLWLTHCFVLIPTVQ